MGRYLVIANETVGGDELVEEVRRRVQREQSSFHVVVPALTSDEVPADGMDVAVAGGGTTSTASYADPKTGRDAESPSGTTGTPGGGVASGGERDPADDTRMLLLQVMDRLQRVAEDVSGDVGASDPEQAATDALAGAAYDGLILATPPPGASKVVGRDLSHRIEKAVDIPVTTVHAERTDPRTAE